MTGHLPSGQWAVILGGSSGFGLATAQSLNQLTREGAARFSFLLSIPVISLSGALVTLDLIKEGAPVQWSMMIIGTVLAGVTAYLCIHFFLKLLERIGMLPFVAYRLILGVVLVILFI